MDAILRLAPQGVIADPFRVELAQISTGVKDRRIKCLLFNKVDQKRNVQKPPHVSPLAALGTSFNVDAVRVSHGAMRLRCSIIKITRVSEKFSGAVAL